MNELKFFYSLISFSVALVDMNDQPLANTNRIPLSIAIYTYENPPKCLDTNTAGIIYYFFWITILTHRKQNTQRKHRKGFSKWLLLF